MFGTKIRKVVLCAAVALAAAVISQPVSATVFNIVEVQNGVSSGFGHTLFHSANPSLMGGSVLERAGNSQSPIVGSYNDSTGAIQIGFGLQGGGSVSGTGSLDFGVAANAPLGSITFDFTGASTLGNGSYTLTFLNQTYTGGNSPQDPNSFTSIGGNTWIMALWGANNYICCGGLGGFAGATLGADLRLSLTPVPLPAALPLLASALAGLGFLGWRRRRPVAA